MKESYVDWSKIPEQYKWVAVDSAENTKENLELFGFLSLPNTKGVGMFTAEPKYKNKEWYCNPEDRLVPDEAILKLLPSWDQSKIQRPEGGQ